MKKREIALKIKETIEKTSQLKKELHEDRQHREAFRKRFKIAPSRAS